VTDDTTAAQVLKTLAEKKLLSAPVFHKEANDRVSFVGFADVLDIFKWSVGGFDKKETKTKQVKDVTNVLIRKVLQDAHHHTIRVNATSPGYAMAERLAVGQHRAAIFQSFEGLTGDKLAAKKAELAATNGICNICSQSDIARYISKELNDQKGAESLKQVAQKTIVDLALGYKPVMSVSTADMMYDALNVMARGSAAGRAANALATQKYQAERTAYQAAMNDGKTDVAFPVKPTLAPTSLSRVVVVDAKTNKFVNMISASTFRAAWNESKSEFLHDLKSTTVGDFLKAVEQPSPPTVARGAKFETVLNGLVQNKAHGVIVADAGKAVGVITLTDMMRLFSTYPKLPKGYVEQMKSLNIAMGTTSPKASGVPMAVGGVLRIKVKSTAGFKAGDFLGKSEVYVTVAIGAAKFTTSVVQGKEAVAWQADNKGEFVIDEKNAASDIVVTVWDKDTSSDDDKLGSWTAPVAWVLQGFGANAPIRSFSDSLKLAPKGNVDLDMTYTTE
jgi:CBS domain-containing protein